MTIEYENFYNISMEDFYCHVSEIQSDLGFNFHNSLRDVENRRRAEIWRSLKADGERAMVWLEITDNGEDIPIVTATDVLRTMNEQGLEKLFFYTNTAISDEIKDIIDGEGHYLFSPSEMIETLIAVEKKNEVPIDDEVRKNVKVPSGFVLIRNYLQAHTLSSEKTYIKTEYISKIVNDILGQLGSILSYLSEIEDIDHIPPEEVDRLRSMQYALLPQLIQVSSFVFTNQFMYVREELFDSIKECIIYIGSIVELESMEIVDQHRSKMLTSIEVLQNVDNSLNDYRSALIQNTTRIAGRLLGVSVVVIIIFVALAFILF